MIDRLIEKYFAVLLSLNEDFDNYFREEDFPKIVTELYPVGNYMFKGVIVNSEHISRLVLVFLLLTLTK